MKFFPNPTVKKVIFQIRYPNLFYIESKIGELQTKIMKEFPESSLLYRQRVLFADLGPDVKIEKEKGDKPGESGAKIWQFKSPNNYQLNVLGDSIDISSDFHKTYNNPKAKVKFRDTIEIVLKNFFDVTQIPVIKRIGLRYIDECPIPQKNNKRFKEYYKTTFPLGRFKIEDAREMQFQTVVSRGKNYLRFVEKIAEIDGENKLVLDFDGFREDIDPCDCLKVTDELHDLIAKEYKKSLKDPVFEYMRKEGKKKK